VFHVFLHPVIDPNYMLIWWSNPESWGVRHGAFPSWQLGAAALSVFLMGVMGLARILASRVASGNR
jgi:hypothetical protein